MLRGQWFEGKFNPGVNSYVTEWYFIFPNHRQIFCLSRFYDTIFIGRYSQCYVFGYWEKRIKWTYQKYAERSPSVDARDGLFLLFPGLVPNLMLVKLHVFFLGIVFLGSLTGIRPHLAVLLTAFLRRVVGNFHVVLAEIHFCSEWFWTGKDQKVKIIMKQSIKRLFNFKFLIKNTPNSILQIYHFSFFY